MMKQFWFQAHWLVGITAGVVLAVVGVTGGILSFENEILGWLNSDVRAVTSQPGSSLAPAELVERLKAAHPEKKVLALSVFGDPTAAAKVTFAKAGEKLQPGRRPRGEVRYANPYNGALIEGKGNVGESFFQGTRSFHRWLTAGDFGNKPVGKQIVDASTLLLVMLALSGLYLRWPRRVGNWRSWLKLDCALKGRSFLWHLHAVLGTWVLVLYLVMALTGLYFGYEWYRNGLYDLTGTPRPPERREMSASGEGMPSRERRAGERSVRSGSGGRHAGGGADLTLAWAAFKRVSAPDGFSVAELNLARGARVEIRYLAAKAPHARAFNTVEIDSASGEIIKAERYATKPAGAKFLASTFPLHSGAYFGLTGTILFMIASLAMPVFAISGWMLYLDRRKKKYAARATARDIAANEHKSLSAAAGDLLIGFASQAGFARQLAWQTAGSLQSAGVSVQVHSLAKLGAEQLSKFKRALFVVSTFGEGEPPDEARSFARRFMHSGSMPLRDMRFGLLALGDRQYQTFCAFGEALEGWLRKQGAEPLFPRVNVDCGQPEALVEWQERLGELTGQSVSAWVEPQFERWRLAERRLLNAGSAGAPMYHIELEPVDAQGLRWEAGDIAEILAPVVPANAEPSTTGAEATDAQFMHAPQADTASRFSERGANAPSSSAVAGRGAPLPRIPQPDARREFSIASIPQDGRLHLVVRQMRRSDGSLGIGSGWLTEHAPLGAFVKLRVRSNPSFHAASSDSPLILIGNGTGIAGLRSHLKARERAKTKGVWLIFGERNEQYDYLYRREIESWRGTGMLERVDFAFSRDQAERLYVQHVLMAQAVTVQEWIQRNAVILVCGSLEGMAPGVDSALRQVLGEPELQRLIAEGRYRRDVY